MAVHASRARKYWHVAGSVTSLAIFVLALWLLHRALGKYEVADIMSRLRETPWSAVAMALVAAAFSYLALGGFDWLATRYIRRPVPVGTVMLASFVSHAVSHSAGFAALTGGAIRYRMYSAAGLSALEVGAIILFCGATFIVGASTLAAIALLAEPSKFAAIAGLYEGHLRIAGGVVLVLVAGYLALCAFVRRPLQMRGRALTLPSLRVAALQVVVAATDIAFAATTLYVLLPPGAPSLWAVIGLYVLANLAGLVAHVPGGLGVFESAIVLMLPELPADAALGALLLFRVVYNLVPLVVGGMALAVYEAVMRRGAVGRAARLLVRELEPALLSLLTFAAGAMLVISSAVHDDPLVQERLPRAVEEGAQLVAAAAGAGLLLTARGVFRRLQGGYEAAQVLLALGAAAALVRGLGVAEAMVCAMLMLVLAAARRSFYRSQSVAALGYSVGWVGAACIMLMMAVWLTVATFHRQGVALEPAMLVADVAAARALRADLAAVVVYIAGVAMSLHRQGTKPKPPRAEDMERAAAIIAVAGAPAANLALRGGHSLFFDPSRKAFIMYRADQGLWVAVGEPVGPEEMWPELAWRFCEASEEAGAQPFFLEVPARPLYLDIGLSFSRIGERGRVRLSDFDLAARRIQAPADLDFAVVPRGVMTDIDPTGRFEVAVVSRHGERVVAATLWTSGGLLTLDRVVPDRAVQDFLCIEAMLWGRRHGFREFELPIAASKAPDSLRQLGAVVGRSWSDDRLLHEKYHVQWLPLFAAVPRRLVLTSPAIV